MHLITAATSAEEAKRNARVALLPIGSFEQHGDFLPISTDVLMACIISNEISAAYDVFLLPPITFSCSHEHAEFPGTVSISTQTLITVVDDIRESLAQRGIQYLVMVNAHGGNYVLSNITQEANVSGRSVALFPGRQDLNIARERAGMVTNTSEDMHAGEWETSILLHAYPDVVRPTYAKNDHDAPLRPHLLITGMRSYTESGIIGRPSAATAEKGKAALESLVETFKDTLDTLTIE